ncbi:MAG: homocysteine S-methyltransferase family protein [Pseudomonadota bacterium]
MSTVTLLDGSIGQELVHRHGAKPTPLWSTTVMAESPDLVGALHADYFTAGATVATTNTYAVLPDRLEPAGQGAHLEAFLRTALAQATGARDAHGSGRIAGALGPLHASYRTDLDGPPEAAVIAYEMPLRVLSPGVDFFFPETIASLAQTDGLLAALDTHTVRPAWLSFTVDDTDGTRLRSGEPLADVLPRVARAPVEAVLVNCSRPEVIGPALDIVARSGKPFGARANGFIEIASAFLEDRPTVDVLTKRTDLTPAAYADFAMAWVAQGATLVGGCCEVGPAHIAAIAARLRAEGYVIQ